MYYELYIDVFFLENFMMDSLLLFLTARILKCRCPYGRLFLGAGLGSLLTCAVVLIPMPDIVEIILYHTAVNSLMAVVGLKIRILSQFAKAMVLLYVCAVFLGGFMQIFRPYMRYVSLFYFAAFLGCLLFLKLWKAIAYLHDRGRHILRVTIYTETGEVEVRALLDTGNRLRDFLTGEPVSVVSPETAAGITGCPEKEKGFRVIPYRCVGGSSVMKVFRVRKMCIHMEEELWVGNVLLGIGEERLSREGEYGMILNPAILSE